MVAPKGPRIGFIDPNLEVHSHEFFFEYNPPAKAGTASNISPEVAAEIAYLMRTPGALSEGMQRPGGRGHYDPNQPRVPAGDPKGGQFASKGYRGGGLGRDAVNPVQVGFRLAHHPVPPGWTNEGHFGNVGVAYSPGVSVQAGPYDPVTDTYSMTFTGRGRVEISTPHPTIKGALEISVYAVDPFGTGIGLSITINPSTNEVTVAGTSPI
jgi:hypothetical protein